MFSFRKGACSKMKVFLSLIVDPFSKGTWCTGKYTGSQKELSEKLLSGLSCLKYILSIGLVNGGYPVNIFIISPQKHMLWYSLEAPRRGASNEYPQHMFLWRSKKNINTFGLKKAP